jgi:hypothetical protein
MSLMVVSAACAPEPPAGGSSIIEQDAPSKPELSTAQVDVEQAPPMERKGYAKGDCPGVESQLGQIVGVPNALDVAQRLGVTTKGVKIQVLLVLSDPDVAFLEAFEVEVGTQSGNEVQAFVPIDRVCELANVEQVLAIRLPSGAAGQ